MKISYRALGLAMLLGLSRPGLGQTSPAREDSVKGRIWTATARRVWADEKLASPAANWATGTAFMQWVLTQKPDKTELGSLWGAVLGRVGKGQPATPTQVAQAILAEISQRKTHKTGALAKVNLQALQVDLAPFVPAASTTSAVVEATDSAEPTATQSVGTAHTVAEDPNPVPEVQAAPIASTYTAQPLEPRYFGMPPALAGVVLALLGAVLGMGVSNQLRNKRRAVHRHHSSHHAPSAEPENLSIMTSPEYRKLQKQNENLSKQIQQLKKQLDEFQKKPVSVPTNASAPAVAAHVSPTSVTAAAVAAQAAELPPPVAAAPPAAEEVSIYRWRSSRKYLKLFLRKTVLLQKNMAEQD